MSSSRSLADEATNTLAVAITSNGNVSLMRVATRCRMGLSVVAGADDHVLRM